MPGLRTIFEGAQQLLYKYAFLVKSHIYRFWNLFGKLFILGMIKNTTYMVLKILLPPVIIITFIFYCVYILVSIMLISVCVGYK